LALYLMAYSALWEAWELAWVVAQSELVAIFLPFY
jgi:hypothetical protein